MGVVLIPPGMMLRFLLPVLFGGRFNTSRDDAKVSIDGVGRGSRLNTSRDDAKVSIAGVVWGSLYYLQG